MVFSSSLYSIYLPQVMAPNIMRNVGTHMTDIQKYTKRTILNIFFLYSSVVVNILLLGLIITSMLKQF